MKYQFSKTTGTINPNLDQTQYIKEQLGPKTTELIDITDKEIEELEKALQEDTRVANNENEQPSVHERAREKIRENTKKRTHQHLETALSQLRIKVNLYLESGYVSRWKPLFEFC